MKANNKRLRNKAHILQLRRIKDYSIDEKNIDSIIYNMADSGGFESRNLFAGVDILKRMQGEKDCTKFLSFVGALISTGSRGIIRDMLKNKMFDCVVTTCGALDHDIVRTYGKYYAGEFRTDDSTLLKKKIHRLGNVFVPMNNYGPIIEKKVRDCLDIMYQKGRTFPSINEIISYIGSTLDESSFLFWAHKNEIPVMVPGIVDGAVGSQIWLFNQVHNDFRVDILGDQTILSDLVHEAKRTGAFMIGGGISKHHTLWWNQFRGGLDYAVYITTGSEWDGSLSGALVSEAISWGKVKTRARQTTIHGEATTLLPFIYGALLWRRRLRTR